MNSTHLKTYSISQHGIQSTAISKPARDIINKLTQSGFDAYIVGGAVRDLLLGRQPKDFDIATSAKPEEIKSIFRRDCRIIGRRFRLAHVYSRRELYEVATFRGDSTKSSKNQNSNQIVCDNVFGTIEEDAIRRDFTCNALYYDIENQLIHDYCSGYEDLKNGDIKFIGEPEKRIIEDPIRILRAVKFNAKLGLNWDQPTEVAIKENIDLLQNSSRPRLFDELVKLFHCGNAKQGLNQFLVLGIFKIIFNESHIAFQGNPQRLKVIENAVLSTDQRIKAQKSITPIFLFACFLWPAFQAKLLLKLKKNIPHYDAINKAANDVFSEALDTVAIPRLIQIGIRNIWILQHRFEFTRGKKVLVTLDSPRFRAAYDFLLLRKFESDEIKLLCDWWTHIQTLSKSKQKEIIFPKKKARKKKR